MSNSVDKVLDTIIERIEKGKVLPWSKSWRTTTENGSFVTLLHYNVISGHTYTGINQLACWASGFESPGWITHSEIKKRNILIKKGQKATPILLFAPYEKKITKTTDGKPEEKIEKRIFTKYINVFNVEQLQDGYEEKIPEILKKVKSEDKKDKLEPIAVAEKLISNYFVKVVHGGGRACYFPVKDIIHLPKFSDFDIEEEYYSTKYHELIHSTGHQDRLNRTTVTEASYFGSTNYSEEELVAEIGAAALCAEAGIVNKTINNSISYVNGWLKKLKSDKKILLRAASASKKAVEYILKGGKM